MKSIYKNLAIITAITFGIAACGGGGSSSSSNISPPTPVTSYTEVTFDNVATVPVFASTSTRTIVYVHNYSNSTITGIKYSAQTDITSKALLKSLPENSVARAAIDSFIDPTSAAQCSSLGANSSCPLVITTPILNATVTDASGVLSLSYSQNGKKYDSSQIVNMSLVDDSGKEGVIFSSIPELYSNYKSAYATIYVYGTGEGKSYLIDSLKPEQSFLQITQNDLSGSVIPSKFVQAIEIETPQSNLPYSTELTMHSSLLNNSPTTKATNQQNYELKSNNNFVSTAVISVSGFITGPLLTASTPAVLNTATTQTGSYYIVNSGAQTASITSITTSGGVTTTTGTDNCGTGSLGVGDHCLIYFQVPAAFNPESTVNQGIINVAYNSSNINTPIYWYNSMGGALVSLTPNSSFNITQGTTGNVTITAKNIGGYPLTVTGITASLMTGQAQNVTITNNLCSGNPLAIGGTCTFQVNASDSNTEAGNILINFSGTYANSQNPSNPYARVYVLPYTVTANDPNLVIATINPLVIYGSGIAGSESTVTVTVTNTGPGPATVTGTVLNPSPAYLTSSGCSSGTVAGNGGTCTATFTLGPWESDTQTIGTSSWVVNYSGAGNTYFSNTDVNYTINPPNFIVSNFQVTGSANPTTGGTLATPFIFNGNTTNQSYIITYQNNTGVSTTVSAIQDNITNPAWVRTNSGNYCGSAPIPAGGTCTITYTNNLANIVAAATTATYTENLGVPTLILSLGNNTYMSTTPTIGINSIGSTIYATSNQLIITNSATQLGGSVTIKQTVNPWTGSGSYAPVTLTTMFENYTQSWVTDPSCSASASSGGIITQTCTTTPTTSTINLTNGYPTNSALIPSTTTIYLHILFSINSGGQVVAFSPYYILLPVGNSVN